ncbi:MAG: Ribosomal RNA small subunit methyltransferase E [Firmicutes bacterium ADurb.Bin248]|nr:MAG: Ribosomal RNA small subunit methyltransferase E [Firmicutes bacterium ADurb.Bin248]HPK15619.1 16S rRNA (uracil(1498)-N(3))-methyltransferase [Clostridia bacterium]
MSRFFVEQKDILGGRAFVSGEDARHISAVLRLSRGDEATLCDGAGTDYRARVERIEKDRVAFAILASSPSEAEPETRVTLFQGLPKAGKLEAVIQKCVELGVYAISPVAAARSVVRLTAKEFAGKLPRYQKVACEAAKQSGRGIVPEVRGLARMDEIDPGAFDAFLLPYEGERRTTLRDALRALDRPRTIGFAIGPEGGFEPDEVARLREKGAACVTLGKRILRTETAGPAVLAMLLYELEENA